MKPSAYLETSIIGAYLDNGEPFRRDLTIHLVSTIDEAVLLALTPPTTKHQERRTATRVQSTVQ